MVSSNAYTRLTVVRSGHGLRFGGHAGQIERFRGKRMDLELKVEPCIPPVNTVPHNGEIERLGGKRMDLEFKVEPCIHLSTLYDTMVRSNAWEERGWA